MFPSQAKPSVNLQVSEDLKSLHHVHDTLSQTGQVKETLKPSRSFLERYVVMEMTQYIALLEYTNTPISGLL